MDISICTDKSRLLTEDAFSVYASCMYRPSFEAYSAHIEACLADPYVKIYVCTVSGERAGILILRIKDSDSEIVGIAVSPRFRRRGIGKAMLCHVAKQEKLTSIRAQTDADAIGFYRSCGFSEEKTIVEYPDGKAIRYNCVRYV